MKMKLRNSHFATAVLAASALVITITSCGDAPQADNAITESEVTEESISEPSEETMAKVQDIFYAVPSPMDMASLLKKSGASYDMNLLNDVKRANGYSTSKSQAMNLGVYGADLSYASIFNQNQESIIYLSCTKKLADKLGVTKAFDDTTIERMEANVENRDSLLNIVSETYFILDAYLKENDRDNISAMVIAAGWVEGLYLATSIATNDQEPNQQLLDRIAEQKISLDNLTSLVEAYNTDNSLDDILADLGLINAAFGAVSVENEKSEVTQDENGATVIGGATESEMSPEALQEIAKVVAEIRTRYVS